jgi:hypothetical protein
LMGLSTIKMQEREVNTTQKYLNQKINLNQKRNYCSRNLFIQMKTD